MKRYLIIFAVLAVCAFSSFAYAADNASVKAEKETAQTAVAVDTVQTAVAATTGMIGNRIAAVQAPGGPRGQQGQASGNGANGFGVWALGGAYYMESTKSGAKYDGSLYSVMAGIDKEIGQALVGVAIGYEGLNLDTKYNDGDLKYNGFTVMPYASYAITSDIIADIAVGVTWLDYDISDTQQDGAGGHRKFDSSYNAFRVVTSAGISKYFLVDKWTFSARLGGLYANEQQDSYRIGDTDKSKTDVYVGQVNLGGRVAYDMGAFQPFIGLTYRQDVVKTGGDSDMSGGEIDLGFNWAPTEQWKVGLTGTYGIREDFYMVGGMLNLRYEF